MFRCGNDFRSVQYLQIAVPTQIRSVLLAEDQALTRRAIQGVLLEMGFVVRAACDGTEGCALIDEMKDACPQLLITDIDMPGCDGEELARYARQHCDQIKVLFMSGAPQPGLLELIATDANARLIGKPFNPAALLAVLKDLGVA